jgi:hypothetical protein
MIDADVLVFFCAPYSRYPTKPEDYSPSKLVDCPHCNEKMWLTEKKEAIISANKMDKEIILACFDCFIQIANDRPELREHIRINI